MTILSRAEKIAEQTVACFGAPGQVIDPETEKERTARGRTHI